VIVTGVQVKVEPPRGGLDVKDVLLVYLYVEHSLKTIRNTHSLCQQATAIGSPLSEDVGCP